jgi:hypothetical protein
MSQPSHAQAQNLAKPLLNADRSNILQRQCKSCGQHTIAGECSECKKKQPLQRQAVNSEAIEEVPPIVGEVLRSAGQPLDAETRSLMESRFNHDFSQVRVHTNPRAAKSAQAVNAQAYTIGQNIVFGHHAFSTQSQTGQQLLAHELAHVVQQNRGGTAQPLADKPELETDARQAAASFISGMPVSVTSNSAIGMARNPLSLNQTIDLPSYSQTQLEQEAEEIEKHLNANPVSNEENDRLMQDLERIRQELARRGQQERKNAKSKSKRKREASQQPRSLRESFAIDDTLSDTDLYSEIDAIHEALRSGVSKADQRTLQNALRLLRAEQQKRKGIAAAEERADKIRRAFTPTVSNSDGEALVETMAVLEAIHPSSTASGLYTLFWKGEVITLTQVERDELRHSTTRVLKDNLRKIIALANGAQQGYDFQKEVDTDFPVVSRVVKFVGDVDDPGSELRKNVVFALKNAEAAKVLLERGEFKRAAEFFATSEKFATIAHHQYHAFFLVLTHFVFL